MNINESWHDDAPTSPFVNKEKRCAFKRPSYTGIPVLVSCIVLKGPLKCCLRAVSQLGGISSHFRTEFGFLQFICVFLPLFLLKGPSFTVSLSFLVLGTSFFWLVVAPLHHWMLLYCLSACLEHNDWHHWIPLIVLLGALLALAMATG